jgi:hypothetical protein
MAVFEIPLSPKPQTFGITLAQVSYRMTVRWREAAEGGWFLDIADETGAPILLGLPLVTGADLLAQHRHLGFGGGLYVQTDRDLDAVPTCTNLGDAGRLYFVTA